MAVEERAKPSAGRSAAAGRGRRGWRADPLWARLLVIAGAVLLVTSGGAVVAVNSLVARYTATVTQAPLLGAAAASGKSIDGPINVLLVGIDERIGSPDAGARSDSVIILHIPAAHDAAYVISLPRDTRVTIPEFPQTRYRGGVDKLNAAFEWGFANNGGRTGGFQLLAATVHNLTGLSFNGGVIVNFPGFQRVVDAVGGITMCVDEETTSIHVGWNIKTGKQGAPFTLSPPAYNDPRPIRGMRPQVYHVGCQPFNGWQALDYVRQRELIPDGDYGRQRHQQQFLKALAKKVATAGFTNPVKLDSVLRAAGQTLTVDTNQVPLQDWLFTLKGIDPGNVVMLKSNGGHFNSKVINGQSFEVLDDTTNELLQALRSDQVGPFITAHPEIVGSDAKS